MLDSITTSEIVFSARYFHKGEPALRNLPDDILDLYLRSIPEEYQEMNRRKDREDLKLAACWWRHWIYSKEEAEALGYMVDLENRVGGLYALAMIDKIKTENYQEVIGLASKWGFERYGEYEQRPAILSSGEEIPHRTAFYNIDDINAWRRLNENAIIALAGDYNRTAYYAAIGIIWAPEALVKKYQPDSLDGMPLHLI